MKPEKTRQGIIKAFNAAIEGILYTFKFERNMKIHYLGSVAVLIISLFFNFDNVTYVHMFSCSC